MLDLFHFNIMTGSFFNDRENTFACLHLPQLLPFIQIETTFSASLNEFVPCGSLAGRLKRTGIVFLAPNFKEVLTVLA